MPEDKNAEKRPLNLTRPGRLELKKTVDAGIVKQSFSHGRMKQVSVETKAKRSVTRGDANEPASVGPSAVDQSNVGINADPVFDNDPSRHFAEGAPNDGHNELNNSAPEHDFETDLAMVEGLLACPLGPSLIEWLRTGEPKHAFGLPLSGLPSDPSLDSCWGATLLLQSARPDLAKSLLAVRILDNWALCLDVQQSTNGQTPIFEVELHGNRPPVDHKRSFESYLRDAKSDLQRTNHIFNRVDLLLAKHDIEYDHVKGGKPPRAHQWRVVRSCVHDRVVGIAGIKQDDRLNATLVDVFETSDHPLYAPSHGLRSLASLVFADAFKHGSSMSVQFQIVPGLRGKHVPSELAELSRSLNVQLSAAGEGIILHHEGVALFAALSGLSTATINRISNLPAEERFSLEALSYLVTSRIWTLEEAEWILAAAPRPAGILFGEDNPEDWLRYAESISYGRAAILATMFRASLNEGGEEGIETSEIKVEGTTIYLRARRPAAAPWLANEQVAADELLAITPWPRIPLEFEPIIIGSDARRLAKEAPGASQRILLYTREHERVDLTPIGEVLGTHQVEVVAAPYRLADLDRILESRLTRARRVRR